MLGWRLTISAILIPLLFGIFALDARAGAPAPWLFGLCLLLAVRSVWELHELYAQRRAGSDWRLVSLAAAGVLVGGWWPHWRDATTWPVFNLTPLAIAFVLCVLALFLDQLIRFQTAGNVMESLGFSFVSLTYCGLLLATTAQLRWVAGSAAGYVLLGSLLVSVKGGDIGGYTWGRLFGKRKMAPRLSPGKTWAGAVGAIGGAALASWLWLSLAPGWLAPEMSRPSTIWALSYGAMLGVVGGCGDLVESLLKRDAGRKDSAALFPGFGGLLDLLDSVLYAGPVALLWWWKFG